MSPELSSFNVISPVSNEIYVTRPYASQSDIDKAIALAQSVFQDKWKSTSVDIRCSIVLKSLKKIEEMSPKIEEELSYQMGRPIKFSKNEIKGYLERANYMIQVAKESLSPIPLLDSKASGSSSSFNKIKKFIKKEPLGIVFVMAAWNYPYLIAVNSIVPAILAVNVVILKHSAQTPLVAERMVQSFIDAGCPPGVFQYLHLSHMQTASVISCPAISFVQFTGSVPGGHAISKFCAGSHHPAGFVPCALELGGADAAYVRSDADLSYTVDQLVDGAFYNSGQSCCGIQRIFVIESLYEQFLISFKEITLKKYSSIGNPLDSNTTLGPLVKINAADENKDMILEDIKAGAKNLLEGYEPFEQFQQRGIAFMAPCILTNVQSSMHILEEEIFGPVVAIIPVSSDKEAIKRINESRFGLTASVWTADTDAVELIGGQLDVGTVYQNNCDYLDPSLAWVGVKESGHGISLSKLSFDQFTRPKSFYLKS